MGSDNERSVYMRDECVICEGYFEYSDVIIEVKGDRYCEVCYKETEEENA